MKRTKYRRSVFDTFIYENINSFIYKDASIYYSVTINTEEHFAKNMGCIFCKQELSFNYFQGHMRYHYNAASDYLNKANKARTNQRIYNYLLNERTAKALMKIGKVD